MGHKKSALEDMELNLMQGGDVLVLRAKTIELMQTKELTHTQRLNSEMNLTEMRKNKSYLESYPRRIVLELTNICNLNCIMCGRNDTYFEPTVFNIDWLHKLDPIMPYVEEVTLMGWGEPTLHSNFEYILQYINKYNARKYFCTNGTRLGELKSAIFDNHVDIIAVSLDGATKEINNEIRLGSDFNMIINNIKEIVAEKKDRKTQYPYINFVTTLMKRNLNELVEIITLASEIGLEEVKAVYFTSFSPVMDNEALYGHQGIVKDIFNQSIEHASKLGIHIKLPEIQGEDNAGDKPHKDCFVAWRDLFIGSDGYVRPCMSTPIKFCNLNSYKNIKDIWNSEYFVNFRRSINAENMAHSCKKCYQSSCANWNKKESFIQTGEEFYPQLETGS